MRTDRKKSIKITSEGGVFPIVEMDDDADDDGDAWDYDIDDLFPVDLRIVKLSRRPQLNVECEVTRPKVLVWD